MSTYPCRLRRHVWPALLAMCVGVGLLAALCLLLAARPTVARAAPQQTCDDVVTRYHTRTMQIWYGSLLQDSTVLTDVVELTDHVGDDLASQIAATYTDTRVTAAIHGWVITDVDDMEWVLGEPENLNAEQSLRNRLAGVASNTMFEPVVHHSDRLYFLTGWTTIEEAPECPNGLRAINNEGYARVEYHELNVQVVPATATPTATPTATTTPTPTPTTPFRAYLPLLVR